MATAKKISARLPTVIPGTFNVFQRAAAVTSTAAPAVMPAAVTPTAAAVTPMVDAKDTKSAPARVSKPLIEWSKISIQIVYGDLKAVDLKLVDEGELAALEFINLGVYRTSNRLDYLAVYAHIEDAINRLVDSNRKICGACMTCRDRSTCFTTAQLWQVEGIRNECKRNIEELQKGGVKNLTRRLVKLHNADVLKNRDILEDLLRLCC